MKLEIPVRRRRSSFRSSPTATLQIALVASLLLASTLLVGCEPADPIEQVVAQRARYAVELTGFFPKPVEPPVVSNEELMDEAGDELDEAADELAEGETEDAAEEIADAEEEIADEIDAAVDEAMDQETTIVFDVAVICQGKSDLEGVTVEIEHVDGQQTVKETWTEYLETGPMRKGETRQISFELEGVEYRDGDAFSVTLLRSVDPDDYDDYPEFQAARG